jgi:hypothetical protein
MFRTDTFFSTIFNPQSIDSLDVGTMNTKRHRYVPTYAAVWLWIGNSKRIMLSKNVRSFLFNIFGPQLEGLLLWCSSHVQLGKGRLGDTLLTVHTENGQQRYKGRGSRLSPAFSGSWSSCGTPDWRLFAFGLLSSCYTHAHTLTHTHTQTLTLTHKYTLTQLSHSRSAYTLIHSHIHTLTYTHSHTYTLTLTHPHIHTHKLSHSHINTHSHTHTHTHIYTLTHTHTHIYTLTHVHTHTLIHSHSHIHTPRHTHTHTRTPVTQRRHFLHTMSLRVHAFSRGRLSFQATWNGPAAPSCLFCLIVKLQPTSPSLTLPLHSANILLQLLQFQCNSLHDVGLSSYKMTPKATAVPSYFVFWALNT